MIVDERITAYINSLSLEEIPFLEELEQTALKNRVPIIRKETPEPFENVSADEMSDSRFWKSELRWDFQHFS